MLMKYDASDEEILAYYRQRDPYITLDTAKKHWLYSMRWWHLAGAAKRGEVARRRAAKLEKDLRTAVPSPPSPPLRIAQRYAAGRPRRSLSSSP